MDNTKKLLSPFDLIEKSAKIYAKSFWGFIAIMSAFMLATILLGASGAFLFESSFNAIRTGRMLMFAWGASAGIISFLFLIIILTLLQITAIVFIRDKDKNPIESFKKSFKYFWSYFFTNILTGILVIIGLILFIIPGIIFMIRFFFADLLTVVEHKKTITAMKRSRKLTKGYFWAIMGRALFLMLVSIFISAVFGFLKAISIFPTADSVLNLVEMIVNFLVSPIFIIYFYLLYKNLKEIKDTKEAPVMAGNIQN